MTMLAWTAISEPSPRSRATLRSSSQISRRSMSVLSITNSDRSLSEDTYDTFTHTETLEAWVGLEGRLSSSFSELRPFTASSRGSSCSLSLSDVTLPAPQTPDPSSLLHVASVLGRSRQPDRVYRGAVKLVTALENHQDVVASIGDSVLTSLLKAFCNLSPEPRTGRRAPSTGTVRPVSQPCNALAAVVCSDMPNVPDLIAEVLPSPSTCLDCNVPDCASVVLEQVTLAIYLLIAARPQLTFPPNGLAFIISVLLHRSLLRPCAKQVVHHLVCIIHQLSRVQQHMGLMVAHNAPQAVLAIVLEATKNVPFTSSVPAESSEQLRECHPQTLIAAVLTLRNLSSPPRKDQAHSPSKTHAPPVVPAGTMLCMLALLLSAKDAVRSPAGSPLDLSPEVLEERSHQLRLTTIVLNVMDNVVSIQTPTCAFLPEVNQHISAICLALCSIVTVAMADAEQTDAVPRGVKLAVQYCLRILTRCASRRLELLEDILDALDLSNLSVYLESAAADQSLRWHFKTLVDVLLEGAKDG